MHLRSLTLAVLLAAAPCAAEKKPIQPPGFPQGGPFTPGILSDGTLYIAGQTGTDLKTQKLPEEFEAEVKATLDRIGLILKAAGMTFGDTVSVQVFLTDMELFPRMNAVYTKYFPEPRPARATVGVAKLVGSSRIEISAIAHK